MKQVLDVNTGEVKAGTGESALRSIAIGSCVVVAAYDFKRKIGAMAHVMLPGNAPENSIDKTKYAANAIEELINMITPEDSKQCNIEACLVGAGNVLKKEDDTICDANIRSTAQILKEKHIPVRASVLGGTNRKSIFMDIENWVHPVNA
jgi:chemotaxis protein CheD